MRRDSSNVDGARARDGERRIFDFRREVSPRTIAKVPRKRGGGESRRRPYVTAHGSCRYVILFLCLKGPSSSVDALWGTERGPRARGRCSVTHAPLLLHITYLYLENSHVQGGQHATDSQCARVILNPRGSNARGVTGASYEMTAAHNDGERGCV